MSGDNFTGGNGIDDEDDHDPELITIETIDLAIEKTLVTTGVVQPGDNVIFNVEVFNQGNIDVDSVMVADYIPTDMNYVSPSAIND